MKKITSLLAGLLLMANLCFSQAITITEYNPFLQTPNMWGGGQSWTALGAIYNDIVALNNVTVATTGNNAISGNNTFSGTSTFSGTIAGLKATYYSDSVGTKQSLVASQSGLVVLLKFLNGDTIALPASATCAIGTQFVVNIVYSPSSIGHCVVTNGSDVFYGSVFVTTTTTTSPFASTANKTMLMTSTTTGGLLGGWVSYLYLGGGKWQTKGNLYGSGTCATPFKN